MTQRSRRPIEASIRTPTSEKRAQPGELLREALSHWASGVAVLAASDGEEIDAITVTAFTGLSLDPPLVLVGLGEQTSILPMLREERRFVISILAAGQQAVAGVVAQRLPGLADIFEGPEEPAVVDAMVHLTCTLWREYEGGDHRIIVGEVERVSFGRETDPLLYHHREYRSMK